MNVSENPACPDSSRIKNVKDPTDLKGQRPIHLISWCYITLVHSHVGFILLALTISSVESTQAFIFYVRRKGVMLEASNQRLFTWDLYEYRRLLLRVMLITNTESVAGSKCSIKGILLKPEFIASGIWYDQDHELDTLKCHTWRGYTQSRCSLYINGCLYAIVKAFREISTPFTTSPRFNQCKGLKQNGSTNIRLLRDPTASTGISLLTPIMRRRNFHTSGRVEKLLRDAKGNKLGMKLKSQSPQANTDSDNLTCKVHITRKSDSLVTFTRKELQLYKDRRGVYNGLINILKKPEFLVACYEDIKGKPGKMTKGTTNETLDGLSWEWFTKLGKDINKGAFNFTPARRVLIPKSNGKTRPLGINSPREKIVQKALAVTMEQIWEERFLDSSHGFRPSRSVHTALKPLYLHGTNYTWVIQGDINKCFDSIPHDIITKRVGKVVKCNRTLELLKKSLTAGYIDPESKKQASSGVGTPQGSVLSPLLCNIVLHELDKYIEEIKTGFESGQTRRKNPIYEKLANLRKATKDRSTRISILQELRRTPSTDPMDPNFRRLMYVRYADDFVILIAGKYSDANLIRTKIKDFLREKCGLELNLDKTLISDIKDGFKFLGAHCRKLSKHAYVIRHKTGFKKRATMRLLTYIDLKKVYRKLVSTRIAKFEKRQTIRGTARNDLINFSHADIVAFYNSKIRGLHSFFSFAGNRSRLVFIFWVLKSSCALTLAKKYKVRTQGAIFKKFGWLLECPETGVKIIKYDTLKAIHDYKSGIVSNINLDFLDISWATKLTESNIRKVCVLCGTSEKIEMHHLRSVKDVRQKIRTGNASYAVWSGAFKRKQIPLCKYHHNLYHAGKLNFHDIKLLSNFTKIS